MSHVHAGARCSWYRGRCAAAPAAPAALRASVTLNWAMRLPDEQRYHSSTNASARVAPDSWLPPRLIASVTLEPSGPRIQGRMSSIDFPCIGNVDDEALQNKQVANSISTTTLLSVESGVGWRQRLRESWVRDLRILAINADDEVANGKRAAEARVKWNLMRYS